MDCIDLLSRIYFFAAKISATIESRCRFCDLSCEVVGTCIFLRLVCLSFAAFLICCICEAYALE